MENKLKINVKEQKQIQLLILKELKKVCDDNNIKYFLGGGTLLGAIRHRGYIPWDDDIDVMLLRNDYERLLKIFNDKCKNKEYKLISYKNTKDYYYPFAKIVDMNTKMIEYSCKEISDMGVYIDVFPIDYLPVENRKINKIYRKYKLLNKFLGIYIIDKKDNLTNNKLKKILKKPIKFIIEKFKINTIILKSIDNLGIKNKKTNKVACISGRYFEKEIMSSEYISDYILVEFEGDEYKAPIGYDSYLTKHYGNYMILPPIEKQISNHNNSAYWRC